MRKRVSIAVCLSFWAAFALGAGCASVPDSRKILPVGFDAGPGNGGAGGDSTGGTGGRSGTGGANGSGGTGKGGSSGAGGGVGSGGTGVTDGGVPVGIPCGTAHCPDRKVGGATLTACCAGSKKDTCGFETAALGTTTCIGVNQPGSLDSKCADQSFGSGTLRGCCRPNATCGLLVEPPGGPNFGCVDPSEAGVATTSTCTPPVCALAGKACAANSDCCAGGAGLPVCVTFLGATSSTCSEYCVTNGDCPSGCCVTLTSGRGVCAPDSSSCSAQCRKVDETCDADGDCCSGFLCAPSSDIGPRLCRPACTTNADCSPEFCVKDTGGRSTCSTADAGLCTDTCRTPNDGYCDDGGPGSDGNSCALGTDCTDCAKATQTNGVRLGGTALCSDSCSTNSNGKCEDGGSGSISYTCSFGEDCTDCGPRLGICSNYCTYANDGSCDDGGPGSAYNSCALGTDCGDCGTRIGGRGQTPCDGTHGNLCTPGGGLHADDMVDDICQCLDCAWDAGAHDCKATASKCDGKTISTCCAPGNPCNFDGDGVCDCGGWCDWETKDCGPGASGPRCDGVSTYWDPTACNYTNPSALNGDGSCDCYGACSWDAADCASLGTLCTDTCATKHNGVCGDGGLGSILPAVCTKGTDCADCGPR
jgi:hypothetical protein